MNLNKGDVAKRDDKDAVFENDKSYMYIENIRHTAFEDGKKKWTLKADYARLKKKEDTELFIEKPVAIFFLADDKKVKIIGNEAILDTKTGNIETKGDVSAESDDGTLFETSQLMYNGKEIFSKNKTKVSKQGSQLFADSFVYDLSKNTAEFKGNIKGFLSEIPNL